MDSGLQVRDSGILVSGIPIVSGIPDSALPELKIPKPRIPDSTRQNFPEFRNLDYLTCGETVCRHKREYLCNLHLMVARHKLKNSFV